MTVSLFAVELCASETCPLENSNAGISTTVQLFQWQNWHLHGQLSWWNEWFCLFTVQDVIKREWLKLELFCVAPRLPEGFLTLHSDYLPFPALAVVAACGLWVDKLCGALFPGVHQNFRFLLVSTRGFASHEGRGNGTCLDLYVHKPCILEGAHLRRCLLYLGFFGNGYLLATWSF